MTRPRTVIADDQPVIREVLRGLIEPNYEVVEAVDDGQSAIDAIERLRPELLLLDVSMPGMGGFDVLRSVRSRFPSLLVIFVTEHTHPAYQDEARKLGAQGFIVKRTMHFKLLDCMREVLAGHTYGL